MLVSPLFAKSLTVLLARKGTRGLRINPHSPFGLYILLLDTEKSSRLCLTTSAYFGCSSWALAQLPKVLYTLLLTHM